MNLTKLYIVGGVLVEATKSEGGAFYDIKIIKTGGTGRYLAEIFETIAKEVKDVSNIRNTQDFDRFLNSLIEDGYQPVMLREIRRCVPDGYHWKWVMECYVTAWKPKEAAK
jgi:hypothetical protein